MVYEELRWKSLGRKYEDVCLCVSVCVLCHFVQNIIHVEIHIRCSKENNKWKTNKAMKQREHSRKVHVWISYVMQANWNVLKWFYFNFAIWKNCFFSHSFFFNFLFRCAQSCECICYYILQLSSVLHLTPVFTRFTQNHGLNRDSCSLFALPPPPSLSV